MKTILSLISFFLISVSLMAQAPEERLSRQDYIDKYAAWAVKEMKTSGVPASITLAQGMLESDNGNSSLARVAKNHFGIKCHKDWDGKTFIQDDDAKDECFRHYKSVYDSYKDHSDFLRKYSRYAFLFELKPTDYKGWAKGLRKAGYATNPKYPQLLIKIIEDNELYKYDKVKKIKDIEKDEKDENNNQLADNKETKKETRKERRLRLKKNNNLEDAGETTINALGREIKTNNRIKYIVVKENDNVKKLAKELEIMPWQIYKYNDLKKDAPVKKGQRLYIQPKRGKAAFENDYHTVKEGETMYSISQKYGIKLKALYKKNLMKMGSEPKVGAKLNLRKFKRAG